MTYSRDELLSACLDYFDSDDLAADVWINKYAMKDNNGYLELTPADMHRRMAKEFARVESSYQNPSLDKSNHSVYGQKYSTPLTEDKIFSYFDHFKLIVPQGSVMAILGNPNVVGSLSNCVTLPEIFDSYGGIAFTDQQLMQLYKRRCGAGIDVSSLRPDGMVVSNAAGTSTGAVSFMDRFSNTTREVAQNGRRGALMISMDIRHPDAKDFALIKQDPIKVTGANISLKLTDDFMMAVRDDADFMQRWPVDSDCPVISEVVKAKDLWNIIVNCAWKSAEPGIMYWDRHHWYSPSSIYDEYRNLTSNPCQPGFAPLLSIDGRIKCLSDVREGEAIWSEMGWTKVVRKVNMGIRPVYKFCTTAGSFVGTEDHRVISGSHKIEVRHASEIDVLAGYSPFVLDLMDGQDVMDGLMIGDGSVHMSSKEKVYLTIGINDQDYFDDLISSYIREPHAVKYANAYKVKTTVTPEELPHLPVREIPHRFLFGSFTKICGFLRGLFSANGSVVHNRVTLKTTSFAMLEQVQLMLSAVGIRSYFTTNKPITVEWPNGVYTSKESYTLNISTDRDIFQQKIGFIQQYKKDRLNSTLEEASLYKDRVKTHDIIDVEYLGDFDVFDITVDNETHTYWTGGLNVSNCAEISMQGGDSCRLMAMNLFGFVANPFASSANFDFFSFYTAVYDAQRLMDDLVDLELESVQKILDKIDRDPEPDHIKDVERRTWQKLYDAGKRGRRTGLGFTGLADALAALGHRFDSDEAMDVFEQIMKTKCRAEFESSVDLAIERGPFVGFDPAIESTSLFVQMLAKEFPLLHNRMMKFGRRNVSISTVAPTGSLSLLTQTSSGIEPVFALSHKRRVKINPSDSSSRIDYTDALGDKWQEYDVWHPKFKLWRQVSEKKDVVDSPYHKSTAEEIAWRKRLQIQAIGQRYTSHSLSSTLNLPSDTTPERIAEIYMTAWEMGLKGITVYRAGSRSGVLVSDDGKVETLKENHAPRRPKTLDADVVRFVNGGEKWYTFVGCINKRPYEIFTGRQSDFPVPPYVEQGKIRRTKENGRGKYDFIYIDRDGKEQTVENLHKAFNPESWNYAKLISAIIRHGIPLKSLVPLINDLAWDGEAITTWKAGVARTLKRYISDGTPNGKGICANCQMLGTLVFEEGCEKCTNCGWTKCD